MCIQAGLIWTYEAYEHASVSALVLFYPPPHADLLFSVQILRLTTLSPCSPDFRVNALSDQAARSARRTLTESRY